MHPKGADAMKRINDSQGGSAVLTVVVTLLIGMSMLAFFANRSLIFEQKTSANQTRSTKAMEAAEAGLEWALANLNYSRKTNATCAVIASPATSDRTFRERYLDPDNNGSYAEAFSTLTPACVYTSSGWTCSCPTAGNPSLGSADGPTFTVSFQQVVGQPQMAQVTSVGCTSPARPCVPTSANTADSTTTVSQLIKLQPALATPPAAPLTARGNVNFGSNAIQATNTDLGTNGITINAGGTINNNDGSKTLSTVPGTPPEASLVPNDTSLSSLTGEQMFQTFFGQSKTTFQNAPTTTQVTCSNPCNSQITNLVNSGSRVIWVNGDMDLNSNITVGSQTNPVILVVTGNAHINGNAVIYGVVYCAAITWNETGGGTARIYGAAIAEGNFTATGSPDPTYDPKTLSNLKTTTGQFARVPGSWRDF